MISTIWLGRCRAGCSWAVSGGVRAARISKTGTTAKFLKIFQLYVAALQTALVTRFGGVSLCSCRTRLGGRMGLAASLRHVMSLRSKRASLQQSALSIQPCDIRLDWEKSLTG